MAEETINFSITVNPATPALVVVDGNGNPLANGAQVTLQPETVGVDDPGQTLFTVSGGVPPYSYTVAGTVPAGDSISSVQNTNGSETVEISGTPTTAGSDTFSVTVSDSAGQSVTVGTGAVAAARKHIG